MIELILLFKFMFKFFNYCFKKDKELFNRSSILIKHISSPYHHFKNPFQLFHLKNITKYSHLPFIYHSGIKLQYEIFLRFYNALKVYKFENIGHFEYRNNICSALNYGDEEFFKKINICKGEDDNDNNFNIEFTYKSLSDKEYVQFITTYFHLGNYKVTEINDDWRYNYEHEKPRRIFGLKRDKDDYHIRKFKELNKNRNELK